MWSIDPEQSIFNFKSYEQTILDSIWQLRISRTLLILFGLVALTLAAIGIYGVIAYMVGQRTKEIGVRLALGASPGEVRKLVISRGLLLGPIGIGLGFVGALLLGRVLANSISGVRGLDPLSFAVALLTLLAVTFAANAIPAWRASRIDPVIALRQE